MAAAANEGFRALADPSRRALFEPLVREGEQTVHALTETSLLDEWLLKSDFRPVVGHKFTFRGEPNPHWDGIVPAEVLVVEPPARLAYRWYDWGVTMTLEPTAGGTRLRTSWSRSLRAVKARSRETGSRRVLTSSDMATPEGAVVRMAEAFLPRPRGRNQACARGCSEGVGRHEKS